MRIGRHLPSRSVLATLAIIGSAALAALGAATATAKTTAHKKHHRRHAQTASGCAGANARVGRASPQVLRSAVVCLINQDRAAHHLPALHASPLLNNSAQGWTNAMVSSDQFTHGMNFAGRISAAGYVWRSAGENIATGYSTPRAVVRAWMASTGHCQNILNPTYRNIGTGISVRVVRGYATGVGTWTQDFALGMHQSAPSGNYSPMNGCPY
jgi:uncharacterized protein YkwD